MAKQSPTELRWERLREKYKDNPERFLAVMDAAERTNDSGTVAPDDEFNQAARPNRPDDLAVARTRLETVKELKKVNSNTPADFEGQTAGTAAREAHWDRWFKGPPAPAVDNPALSGVPVNLAPPTSMAAFYKSYADAKLGRAPAPMVSADEAAASMAAYRTPGSAEDVRNRVWASRTGEGGEGIVQSPYGPVAIGQQARTQLAAQSTAKKVAAGGGAWPQVPSAAPVVAAVNQPLALPQAAAVEPMQTGGEPVSLPPTVMPRVSMTDYTPEAPAAPPGLFSPITYQTSIGDIGSIYDQKRRMALSIRNFKPRARGMRTY